MSKWDIAAGALIIREAGGRISDFRGGDGYLETRQRRRGQPEGLRGAVEATRAVHRRHRLAADELRAAAQRACAGFADGGEPPPIEMYFNCGRLP